MTGPPFSISDLQTRSRRFSRLLGFANRIEIVTFLVYVFSSFFESIGNSLIFIFIFLRFLEKERKCRERK